MLSRLIVLTGVALLCSATGALAQDFEINISLFRGDPKGSREAGTIKVTAAPTLAIKSGEPGSVLVGGTAFVGKQAVTVGQQIRVTAKDLGHGAIRLHVVFEHSEALSTKRTETEATVQSGGIIRVEMGEDPKNMRWVDVTVSKTK